MLSPVMTTRSGSSPARSATHCCLRRWPAVRCRSDRCSSRIGWATASAGAGRDPPAGKEKAEEAILARYLPAQLTDEELADLVREALTSAGVSGKAQMGPAMKAAQAAVAGRAEGGRVAAEVRRQL